MTTPRLPPHKRKIARGVWQRAMLARLLSPEGCPSAAHDLAGDAARRYAGRYVQSFAGMLARLQEAGYTIRRTPGPAGGEWLARYWAEYPHHKEG